MQSQEHAPSSAASPVRAVGGGPGGYPSPGFLVFHGLEELKDTAHSAALLAQRKSFWDARLLRDVPVEVVTQAVGLARVTCFPATTTCWRRVSQFQAPVHGRHVRESPGERDHARGGRRVLRGLGHYCMWVTCA